jgi:rod shape-determining protein MreD
VSSLSPTHEDSLSVSWWFIGATLFAAFMLNLIPWGQFYGVPDFLAITLLYWSIYQRQRVGIAIAFVFGLLMDVNNATILGETALAYTLMTYFAITLHRRILWFSWSRHLGYIFLLLSIEYIVVMVVRLLCGSEWAGWYWIIDCAVGTLIWPIAQWLLSWPSRRADGKENQLV